MKIRRLAILALLLAPTAFAENAWPYREDTAHVSGDRGNFVMAVRNDAGSVMCNATGDYCGLTTDASGNLRVTTGAATAGPLTVVGGGVEATALRVTVASDSTGVLSVDDNGASLTVDNAVLSVVGGGTEAAAQRVTLASDSTGVLSVDDNGASLTVDMASTTLTATVLPAGAGAMVSGSENIEATGTAEQLGSNACKIVILSCPPGNTSDCYFRADTGNGVTGGIIVPKSTSYTLPVSNTNLVWVDAGTNDDNVNWVAVN